MKSLLLVSFIMYLIFWGCSSSSDNSQQVAAPSETTSNQSPIDTISKATFDQWTALWDSLGSAYSDTSLVKYYDFPIVDLTEFLGSGAAHAYFYQGLEPLTSGGYLAHLILTGIDQNGNSIGSYYDVSRPCPPKCNPKN